MEENKEDLHTNKALVFQLAVSNNFKLISESVSQDEFCRALTVLKTKPQVLCKLHSAMKKQLYDSMNNDLEAALNDGGLQEALKKVSDLQEKSDIPEHEDAWRPPGNVHLHLRSLDAEKILEESGVLKKELTELEEENARLMKEVAERRSRITATTAEVGQSLNRCPQAYEQLEKRSSELERAFRILGEEK